jgi:hypothetical protein
VDAAIPHGVHVEVHAEKPVQKRCHEHAPLPMGGLPVEININASVNVTQRT